MLYSFNNGILIVTNHANEYVTLEYDPETRTGFTSRDAAISYFKSANIKFPKLIEIDVIKEQKILKSKKKLKETLKEFTVSVNGTSYTIGNDKQDQSNNLLAISTSQYVLNSPLYDLGIAYNLNDIVNLGGNILICSTAGTSDSTTATTIPTDFGIEVIDGTAGWKLFGQLVGLAPTGTQFFTPSEVISIAGQVNGYVTNERQIYKVAKDSINAIVIDTAGTYPTYTDAVAALDAIVI